MCGEVSYVCNRKNDGKPEQDYVGFNRESMMRRKMKENEGLFVVSKEWTNWSKFSLRF
jgi:hypothetical protein